MESKAVAKYMRTSPLKMRRVIDLIKGKNVEDALNVLHFSPKRSAKFIEKTLRSAVANFFEAYEGKKITADDLYIKKVWVDEGPMLRRFRPMSMGRVGRIRRRTSHLTIVVEDKKQ
ncbi:50S ribosomal protein L22 [candidate division KSB1 bacterium 4484_188]|nr:MAG: 50S ribosomal protein L22 [candidate division KSB1 bacterium 4484_188]HFE63344.1 50S ribosomal protein L22 [Caldithrix sp.]